MARSFTLPAHYAVILLAALRFKREHKDAVLGFADKRCAPRPMTDADRARLQMEIDDLDEAIAAVEAAR